MEDTHTIDCRHCRVGDWNGLLATYGTGAQEAFQVINSVGNIGDEIYYVMTFAIPLVAGDRFGVRAGFWLKLAAISGLVVSLMAMGFMLLPIVDVDSKLGFALKIAGTSLVLNAVGVQICWKKTRIAGLRML